jgi:hypothetical protein
MGVVFATGCWLRLRRLPDDADLHLRDGVRQLLSSRWDEATEAVDHVWDGDDPPEVIRLLRLAIDLGRNGGSGFGSLVARIRESLGIE